MKAYATMLAAAALMLSLGSAHAERTLSLATKDSAEKTELQNTLRATIGQQTPVGEHVYQIEDVEVRGAKGNFSIIIKLKMIR